MGRFIIIVFTLALCIVCRAEEKPSPVLTALGSTTITGYVNGQVHWDPVTSWPWGPHEIVRFRQLCDLLRIKGFMQLTFGDIYVFQNSMSGTKVSLRRAGPFATRRQLKKVRNLLFPASAAVYSSGAVVIFSGATGSHAAEPLVAPGVTYQEPYVPPGP
jgi:hypothetical protein